MPDTKISEDDDLPSLEGALFPAIRETSPGVYQNYKTPIAMLQAEFGTSSFPIIDYLVADGSSTLVLTEEPVSDASLLLFAGTAKMRSYTRSGKTITWTGLPPEAGTPIDAWYMKAVPTTQGVTQIYRELTLSGPETGATGTLDMEPPTESSLQVWWGNLPLDRRYGQQYNVVGTTITMLFDTLGQPMFYEITAPVGIGVPGEGTIDETMFKVSAINSIRDTLGLWDEEVWGEDLGVGLTMALSEEPPTFTSLTVLIGSVELPKDNVAYTVSGTTVTLAEYDTSMGRRTYKIKKGLPIATPASESIGAAHLKSGEVAAIAAKVLPYARRGVLPQNYTLVPSIAGNALTIALKTAAGNDPSATDPVIIPFRSATVGSGATEWRAVTAPLSLVISSGSTMGFTTAKGGRLWIEAVDNAGTVMLAAFNASTVRTIHPLRNNTLRTTVAEGGLGAADSAGVLYAASAVSNKAIRILGYMDFSLAVPGTWDEMPDLVQEWEPGIPLPGDVVQTTSVVAGNPAATTTSTTMVDVTGASVAIAPTSPVNLVKVDADWVGTNPLLASTNTSGYWDIVRGSTIISGQGTSSELFIETATGAGNNRTTAGLSFGYLDSPNTVANTTYKLQHRTSHASGAVVTRAVNMNLTELMG